MNHPRIVAVAFVLMTVLMTVSAPRIAHSDEIKVLSSGALKLALARLVADFQTSSGNTVAVAYGPAGAIADRARQGEVADVVIATRPQLEGLERQGKVVPGSRIDIAGIAIGVAVRKGAPRPDIGTVEAFKHALRSARSIGYRDPVTGSTSGIYTARMIERLGLADELKSKTRLDRSSGDRPEAVFEAVANGEIEMQIGQITEIAIAPGVDLAGPLPDEIQKVSVLAAGIATTSKSPDAARGLIRFLASPIAAAVLKAAGFQLVAKK